MDSHIRERDYVEIETCLRKTLGYCNHCNNPNDRCDKYSPTQVLKRREDSRERWQNRNQQ